MIVLVTIFGMWKALDYAPPSWLNPFVQLEWQSGEDARVQVFFDHGDGLSEEGSRFVDLSGAPGFQTARFAAKQSASVEMLRFDPHRTANVEITVRNVVLKSPMGFHRIQVQPDHFDQEEGLVATRLETGELKLQTEVEDSWLLVRSKHIDLSMGAIWMWLPRLVIFAAVALISGFLVCCLIPRKFDLPLTFSHSYLLMHVLFLLLFFITPRRFIEPEWYFPTIWILGAAVLALPATWKGRKAGDLLGNLPFLFLLGFVLYFGVSIILTHPSGAEGVPPKREVLHTMAFMGFHGFVLAMIGPRVTTETVAVRPLAYLLAGTAALVAVMTMQHYYQGLGNTLNERVEYAFNPLFRAIVGSAAYALALVILLAVFPRFGRKNIAGQIMLWVVGAILVLFVVQCMSRSVIFPVILATGCLSLAHLLGKRVGPAIVAASMTALTLVLSMTPAIDRLAGMVPSDSNPAQKVETDFITEFDTNDDVREWEDEALGGRQRMAAGMHVRPVIWKAYLKESREKPILGHGFEAPQAVVLTKPGSEPKPSSSHNLFISAFFFGGGIGLVLTLGMFLSVLAVSGVRFLKSRSMTDLIPGACIGVGGLLVCAECSMLSGTKTNVLCWTPTGYWFVIWGTLLMGVLFAARRPVSTTDGSSE